MEEREGGIFLVREGSLGYSGGKLGRATEGGEKELRASDDATRDPGKQTRQQTSRPPLHPQLHPATRATQQHVTLQQHRLRCQQATRFKPRHSFSFSLFKRSVGGE